MSTPCWRQRVSRLSLVLAAPAPTRAGRRPGRGTDRIKHAAECLELLLDIVLLALELGDGELGRVSVCDGRRGRPRGDGGRVESVHGANVSCKSIPNPDQKRPMGSSSWEIQDMGCGLTIRSRKVDVRRSISLPQMTRSVVVGMRGAG